MNKLYFFLTCVDFKHKKNNVILGVIEILTFKKGWSVGRVEM